MRRVYAAAKTLAEASDLSELALLADDTLRKQANEATRISGFGRIKHEDGSYEDLAPHGGGIVRTVLDRMLPTKADDHDWEDME